MGNGKRDMCGRYLLIADPDLLRAIFGYEEQPNFPPRYNIAPTQPVAVVVSRRRRRHFLLARWGLLPAWVKDPAAIAVLFNARSETVLEKASFRNAMRRRRCLVPADGFYEWARQAGGKVRVPFFARPTAGGPIAFAGLHETWMGPNGEELDTVTIITVPANATLARIHERMPAVIHEKDFDTWLDNDELDVEAAMKLLVPAPEDFFELVPVGQTVNRASEEGAHLIEPVAEAPGLTASEAPRAKPEKPPRPKKPAEDPDQGSLF